MPIQLESVLMMPTPGYTPTVVSGQVSTVGEQQSGTFFFAVKVADDAPISTKPYFSRAAFTENRYTLSDPLIFGRPFNPAPLVAIANYTVNGVAVRRWTLSKPRAEPAVWLRRSRMRPAADRSDGLPMTAVVPLPHAHCRSRCDGMHNANAPTSGQLALTLPTG